MGANKKPKRRETLAVQVQTTATPEAIVEAAVTKHVALNKRFNGDHSYRLVYRDRTNIARNWRHALDHTTCARL